MLEKLKYKIIVYAPTSHNRSVYASPPVGGSASATARSFRFAPFSRRCSGTFCRPWKCYAFPYSGRQNVVNSRNVRRNFLHPLLTSLKYECNMKDTTKNLKWFGHGGIRAAASKGKLWGT
jgi:hypothetical protein